jgi:hypothetical protein
VHYQTRIGLLFGFRSVGLGGTANSIFEPLLLLLLEPELELELELELVDLESFVSGVSVLVAATPAVLLAPVTGVAEAAAGSD